MHKNEIKHSVVTLEKNRWTKVTQNDANLQPNKYV